MPSATVDEAERLRERDDRAGDRRALVVLAEGGDEAAVDLQHVEREAVQVGERRVAGAEVVEREADAERLAARASVSIVPAAVLHDARSR